MAYQSSTELYNQSDYKYERQWQGYLDSTHRKMLDVIIPDLEEDDRILDASCGTGLLAMQLLEQASSFRELVLNDVSPKNLGIAHSRLSDDPRVSFTAYPPNDLQFGDNRFTRVICLNALHGYTNPSAAIRQFKNIMTPHGRLYLIDWNRSGWFRFINLLIRWFGKDRVNTMNLSEITQLLQEHHYSIVKTDQWNYRYWRLCLVVAGFQPWRKQ